MASQQDRFWRTLVRADRARAVDHLQRVHPDVPLRMPLRLLWAAGERLQLWKEGGDDAEVHGQGKTDGRPRREQELFDFAPDPLGRQIVERNGPAQRTRLGV